MFDNFLNQYQRRIVSHVVERLDRRGSIAIQIFPGASKIDDGQQQ